MRRVIFIDTAFERLLFVVISCRSRTHSLVGDTKRGERRERRKTKNHERAIWRRTTEKKRVFLAITHCFVDCFGRH